MKKPLFFLCSASLVTFLSFHVLISANFTDVSESHEYYEAIQYVEEQEIVSGYPNGSFQPDQKINRAEFTKIIVNARFDESTIESCVLDPRVFPDFNHEDWFTAYVCLAQSEGIINGYPDGTFQPSNDITFGEAAKMVVNGFDTPTQETEGEWYQPFIDALEQAQAVPPSVSEPGQLITRGEMAEIIYRLLTFENKENAGPPTLKSIQEPVVLSGAHLWLFTVDDGEEKPVLSAEENGNILMGRLDPENPSNPIDWQTVIEARDFSVADHWHIFAHDYHWIVFSTNGAKSSYLVKLNKDFEQIGLYPVASEDDDLSGTNDMFLVEEKSGVAVGHFYAGTGHRIYRLSTEGELLETRIIGGGMAQHSNGASALALNSGYKVFAPQTLAPDSESDILELTFDDDWNLLSSKTLIEEENTQLAMATAVFLDNDYNVLTVRLRDLDEVEDTTSSAGSSSLPSDAGALVQYTVDSTGEILSKDIFWEYENQANRPHATLFNDYVITTWDDSAGIRLQIQAVE